MYGLRGTMPPYGQQLTVHRAVGFYSVLRSWTEKLLRPTKLTGVKEGPIWHFCRRQSFVKQALIL